jgi:hypothetical protein
MEPHNFEKGQIVFSLNLKYKDGTRLRTKPTEDKEGNFNGIWLPNDHPVRIIELFKSSTNEEFANIKKEDGTGGWIRIRNLTGVSRKPGITKGVISNEIITPDPEYIKGIRIYGVGILQDPVPGQKMGKGLQHLISSQWLLAMSEFVGSHFSQLQAFVRHAYEGGKKISRL